MARTSKFPKAETLYALGGLLFMVLWFFTDDTQHLIFVAWFSIMSKLEQISAVSTPLTPPLYGSVYLTTGPRRGSE